MLDPENAIVHEWENLDHLNPQTPTFHSLTVMMTSIRYICGAELKREVGSAWRRVPSIASVSADGGVTAASIAYLKVTLDDVEPVVMGRIDEPLTLRPDCLHPFHPVGVGFDPSYFHEFRVRNIGLACEIRDVGE